ncbi:MAG: hypothetical protein V9E87_08100 [Gemmatimonadales bacterium]
MLADRHSIDLATAVDLTTRWRKHHPDALKGVMFPRASFERLLRDPEAAGIRTYLAEKPDGSWTFVMVATTADGKDIIRKGEAREASGDGTGYEEEGWPCPSMCDCESPLNGECPPP